MICTSIIHQFYERCREIMATAEMVELRLDLLDLSKDQVGVLLKEATIPIIATCRNGKYNDADRLVLLKHAIDNGASYIDVELDSEEKYRAELIQYARSKGCKLIISYHNMEFTPPIEELERLRKSCYSYGADIAKIVTTAQTAYDNAVILSLYNNTKQRSLVAFAMGELGKISRASCVLMGAPFTYASAEVGKEAASGQMTVEELQALIATLKQ